MIAWAWECDTVVSIAYFMLQAVLNLDPPPRNCCFWGDFSMDLLAAVQSAVWWAGGMARGNCHPNQSGLR